MRSKKCVPCTINSSPPPRASSRGLAEEPQHLAILAGADVGERLAHRRHRAELMGEGALHLRALAGGEHGVGVAQRGGERLLQKDVAAGFGGGGDHRHAVGDPARADADDVGFFLREHLAIVRVEARDAEPLARRREPVGIVIGDGHDLETIRHP